VQHEYCGGPINGKAKVLEFANFQRFFLLHLLQEQLQGKHADRIQSVIEQYREMKKRCMQTNTVILLKIKLTLLVA
jgi:hypothetical protein